MTKATRVAITVASTEAVPSLADLAQLEEAAEDHGRDREQERVAGGGDPVEAAEQAGRDRRPERETPGIRASAWAIPMKRPSRPSISVSSRCRVPRRSASSITKEKRISAEPIR